MKKNINITIDADAWLFHRTNNTNLSNCCNELLKTMMNTSEETIDIIEAKNVIEDLKKENNIWKKEMNKAIINLERAKQNELEKQKEQTVADKEAEEQMLFKYRTLRNNRSLWE